jgi:hypothetical protein
MTRFYGNSITKSLVDTGAFQNCVSPILTPVLKGEEIQRYSIKEKGRKAIFPYKKVLNSSEAMTEKELKTYPDL